jgi:hypothetical protein
MLTSASLRLRQLALPCALGLGAAACDGDPKTPALSRSEEVVRSAPVPGENAPKLGVVSEALHVREFTDARAPSLGVLRAGARVARSLEPVSRAGCAGGWYAIRPRGFVCVGVEATLDLAHPTLAAMALAPSVDAKLPYTYARTRNETPLFERVAGRDDTVREIGKLHRRAGMAVVGSWRAKEPSGNESRLALLTDGHFVRAADLEAAQGSDFNGVELDKNKELPVAFVVKRGVRSFTLNGNEAEKGDLIEYHSELLLSGRFRSFGSVKYWAYDRSAVRASDRGDEKWVRHQDVTVVQKRTTFPDFVKDDTHWLDVSATTGTLVAYTGTSIFRNAAPRGARAARQRWRCSAGQRWPARDPARYLRGQAEELDLDRQIAGRLWRSVRSARRAVGARAQLWTATARRLLARPLRHRARRGQLGAFAQRRRSPISLRRPRPAQRLARHVRAVRSRHASRDPQVASCDRDFHRKIRRPEGERWGCRAVASDLALRCAPNGAASHQTFCPSDLPVNPPGPRHPRSRWRQPETCRTVRTRFSAGV